MRLCCQMAAVPGLKQSSLRRGSLRLRAPAIIAPVDPDRPPDVLLQPGQVPAVEEPEPAAPAAPLSGAGGPGEGASVEAPAELVAVVEVESPTAALVAPEGTAAAGVDLSALAATEAGEPPQPGPHRLSVIAETDSVDDGSVRGGDFAEARGVGADSPASAVRRVSVESGQGSAPATTGSSTPASPRVTAWGAVGGTGSGLGSGSGSGRASPGSSLAGDSEAVSGGWASGSAAYVDDGDTTEPPASDSDAGSGSGMPLEPSAPGRRPPRAPPVGLGVGLGSSLPSHLAPGPTSPGSPHRLGPAPAMRSPRLSSPLVSGASFFGGRDSPVGGDVSSAPVPVLVSDGVGPGGEVLVSLPTRPVSLRLLVGVADVGVEPEPGPVLPPTTATATASTGTSPLPMVRRLSAGPHSPLVPGVRSSTPPAPGSPRRPSGLFLPSSALRGSPDVGQADAATWTDPPCGDDAAAQTDMTGEVYWAAERARLLAEAAVLRAGARHSAEVALAVQRQRDAILEAVSRTLPVQGREAFVALVADMLQAAAAGSAASSSGAEAGGGTEPGRASPAPDVSVRTLGSVSSGWGLLWGQPWLPAVHTGGAPPPLSARASRGTQTDSERRVQRRLQAGMGGLHVGSPGTGNSGGPVAGPAPSWGRGEAGGEGSPSQGAPAGARHALTHSSPLSLYSLPSALAPASASSSSSPTGAGASPGAAPGLPHGGGALQPQPPPALTHWPSPSPSASWSSAGTPGSVIAGTPGSAVGTPGSLGGAVGKAQLLDRLRVMEEFERKLSVSR
jgi:hypothetical protein